MPRQHEETELVEVGPDALGRPVQLAPVAARAWFELRNAAAIEGITLRLLSGFRSVNRQTEIVARKLAAGVPWAEILRVNAYPGHSEHHTGRALDLGTPGCADLSADFASTPAYLWLERHAPDHGFHLSYPPANDSGIVSEPWHWYLR